MKDFHELLINRRSIRKYTDEPISADDVRTIMEAALMSPSSKRSTPWEFILVEDKNMLTALSKCKDAGAMPIANCKLAVIVCANPSITDTWVEDASIAATLIQLQAEDLNLGTCWIQIKGRYTAEGEAAQDVISGLISIPEDLQILCAITIGHKDEIKKPFNPDKLAWEKVHIAK